MQKTQGHGHHLQTHTYMSLFKQCWSEAYQLQACFLSAGEEGKSSVELVSPLEVPLKRKGGASVVVEQKLESSEIISETPNKKSRTKQKSSKNTTREEISVTNVKLSKTVVQKETVAGMHIC